MDNYPRHLAPKFAPSGAVVTPFDEWWATAQHAFPKVPENVARHWLHEHWNHSPYAWLPSADYDFELIAWPADRLREIRSTWCDFAADNADCLAHGKHLITGISPGWQYPTAVYMLEHGDFPAPIIVLDNRDGHLPAGKRLPAAYILVEGHRRFNMALYLHSIGKMGTAPQVWVMMRGPMEAGVGQTIEFS